MVGYSQTVPPEGNRCSEREAWEKRRGEVERR